MSIIQALQQELDQEAATTRRVLERVPGDRLSWKPHDKSMSLGQLALHVATVPGNVAELAARDVVPQPPAFVQPEAATTSELLPALSDNEARLYKRDRNGRRARQCTLALEALDRFLEEHAAVPA